MGVGKEVIQRTEGEGKEQMVCQTFNTFSRSAGEAFSSDAEGITPMTFQSTTASSQQHEIGLMNKGTARAMRQLMEHSGQIDLLTRMDHRMPEALSRPSFEVLVQQKAVGVTVTPSSPTRAAATKESAKPPPRRPLKVSLPPPQLSLSDLDKSLGSGTTTGGFLTLGPEQTHGSLSPVRPVLVASGSGSSIPPPTLAVLGGPFHPPLNVLVVDDDPLTRKLMSRMLARNGCNVETAENGQMALELVTGARDAFDFSSISAPATASLSSFPSDKPHSLGSRQGLTRYDLVFLDNQMPILSGVEMVRRLRRLGGMDFVVGVTGNALKEDQEEYIGAGVNA